MKGSSQRLLVAAFGDPGHAFPAIALARALDARGHDVTVESWGRWRDPVEELGLRFVAAEEYSVLPQTDDRIWSLRTAGEAAVELRALFEELRPDALVSDILTVAPVLAAEAAGVPRATLIPHVYPVGSPGLPFFAIGALPPRTPLGRMAWRSGLPVVDVGLRQGRAELNSARERVGLPPTDLFHGGISRDLALVATFPQLEYPREWPAGARITGPMVFEIPHPDVALPPGTDPLVLVAPSTTQDPEGRLVQVALEALAEEPVRVVATRNRPDADRLGGGPEVPANAVLVNWLSYSQLMPLASLVICHGGHGTVARALAEGVPVLACPAGGDMAENGARLMWSGTGLSVPRRLFRPPAARAVVRRLLGEGRFAERARAVAAWGRMNDGAAHGAVEVERFARERV